MVYTISFKKPGEKPSRLSCQPSAISLQLFNQWLTLFLIVYITINYNNIKSIDFSNFI